MSYCGGHRNRYVLSVRPQPGKAATTAIVGDPEFERSRMSSKQISTVVETEKKSQQVGTELENQNTAKEQRQRRV